MKISSGPYLLLPATILLTAAACLFGTNLTPAAEARADAKQEGAALFASSGCAHCHGDAGQGTAKGPALHDVRKKLNAAAMAKQIKEGGQSMPGFADSLDDAQIERLVKFLRGKHPAFEQPAASTSSH